MVKESKGIEPSQIFDALIWDVKIDPCPIVVFIIRVDVRLTKVLNEEISKVLVYIVKPTMKRVIAVIDLATIIYAL